MLRGMSNEQRITYTGRQPLKGTIYFGHKYNINDNNDIFNAYITLNIQIKLGMCVCVYISNRIYAHQGVYVWIWMRILLYMLYLWYTIWRHSAESWSWALVVEVLFNGPWNIAYYKENRKILVAAFNGFIVSQENDNLNAAVCMRPYW